MFVESKVSSILSSVAPDDYKAMGNEKEPGPSAWLCSYIVCECRIRKWQILTRLFSHVILDFPFVNLKFLFRKV